MHRGSKRGGAAACPPPLLWIHTDSACCRRVGSALLSGADR